VLVSDTVTTLVASTALAMRALWHAVKILLQADATVNLQQIVVKNYAIIPQMPSYSAL